MSFNELVRLLGWVYRVYYPGKKRLSVEERKEVIEKLMEWYVLSVLRTIHESAM